MSSLTLWAFNGPCIGIKIQAISSDICLFELQLQLRNTRNALWISWNYIGHFQVLLQLRRTNKAWDSFYSSVRYCVQLVSTNLWKQPEKYREQYLSMAPLYCYIAAKTYFFRQKDSCYIGPHSSVCFVYLFADLCPLLLAPEKMKCHLIPVDVSVYCFVLFCFVSVGGHLDDDMFCCCFFLL